MPILLSQQKASLITISVTNAERRILQNPKIKGRHIRRAQRSGNREQKIV